MSKLINLVNQMSTILYFLIPIVACAAIVSKIISNNRNQVPQQIPVVAENSVVSSVLERSTISSTEMLTSATRVDTDFEPEPEPEPPQMYIYLSPKNRQLSEVVIDIEPDTELIIIPTENPNNPNNPNTDQMYIYLSPTNRRI